MFLLNVIDNTAHWLYKIKHKMFIQLIWRKSFLNSPNETNFSQGSIDQNYSKIFLHHVGEWSTGR